MTQYSYYLKKIQSEPPQTAAKMVWTTWNPAKIKALKMQIKRRRLSIETSRRFSQKTAAFSGNEQFR